MKKIIKVIATIFSLLVLAVISIFVYIDQTLCGNTVYQIALSPDTQNQSIAFERNCGATTSFLTQVTIIDADENISNNAGNVFSIKGRSADVKPKMKWIDDHNLVIEYTAVGAEGTKKYEIKRKTNIKIQYIKS